MDRAEFEAHDRTCDWCGYRIPDLTRIVLGNRRFCSKECADAYLGGVEKQKKGVYRTITV